jgi:hypothetical protein
LLAGEFGLGRDEFAAEGFGEGSAVADAAVVFLPVRKTPDAVSRADSSDWGVVGVALAEMRGVAVARPLLEINSELSRYFCPVFLPPR